MNKYTLKIAVLTSRKSWYRQFIPNLCQALERESCIVDILHTHQNLDPSHKICFILSYFNVINPVILEQRRYNMVVHESALPQGRGWAPLFWQVIEGRNNIPFTMFNADKGIDSGPVYLKKNLTLDGSELYAELREKQAQLTREMVMEFVGRYRKGTLMLVPQKGESTVYARRTPADSELDVNKTIGEQFDLLRTVNNEEFPAFFYMKGKKYYIRITEAGSR